MNGLGRRVDALEALAQGSQYRHDDGREHHVQKLAELADRLRGTPEPPLEHQSPIEQTVRAGLVAAEGFEGVDYARHFWQAVAEKLREYQQRGRAV